VGAEQGWPSQTIIVSLCHHSTVHAAALKAVFADAFAAADSVLQCTCHHVYIATRCRISAALRVPLASCSAKYCYEFAAMCIIEHSFIATDITSSNALHYMHTTDSSTNSRGGRVQRHMFAAPPAVQRATSHSGSYGGYSNSSSFNRGGSTDNLNSLNNANTNSPAESAAASVCADCPEVSGNGNSNGNPNGNADGSANGCSFCSQEGEQAGEEQLPRLELGVSHTSFTGGRVNGSTFLYRVDIDK
jgi:hypothetical protein